MRTRTLLVAAVAGVLLTTPLVGAAMATSPTVATPSPSMAVPSMPSPLAETPSGTPTGVPSSGPTTATPTPTSAPTTPAPLNSCAPGKITASSSSGTLTVTAAGQSATGTATIHNTMAQSFTNAIFIFGIAPISLNNTGPAPTVASSLNGGSYVNLPLTWHDSAWVTPAERFTLGAKKTATLKFRVTFKSGAQTGRYVTDLDAGLLSCPDASADATGLAFIFTPSAVATPSTTLTPTPSAPVSATPSTEASAGFAPVASPGASDAAGGATPGALDAGSAGGGGSHTAVLGLGLLAVFAVAAIIGIVLFRRRRREDGDEGGSPAYPTSGPSGGDGGFFTELLPRRDPTSAYDGGPYGGSSYGGYGGGSPAGATALIHSDLVPARASGYPSAYDDPYAAEPYGNGYPTADPAPRRQGYTGAPVETQPPTYGGGGYGAAPGYGATPAYGAANGYDAPNGYAPATEYAPTNGYDAGYPAPSGYPAANGYDPAGGYTTSTGYDGDKPGYGGGYDPYGGTDYATGATYDTGAGPGYAAQDPRWGEAPAAPAPAQRQPYEKHATERRGRHGLSAHDAQPPADSSVSGWQGDEYGGYPDQSWGYQPQ